MGNQADKDKRQNEETKPAMNDVLYQQGIESSQVESLDKQQIQEEMESE